MSPISRRRNESLMTMCKRCDAVYICLKVDGVRRGPLVAYAGKDEQGRNLVGDIYFNFRRVECHPEAVMAFAQAAFDRLCDRELLDSFDTVCGIPQGGRTFGQMLALVADKRFVYADKKPKPTEPGRKQEYSWDLSQFEFEQGERVAIAEDVFNNFQNTDCSLAEIAAFGVNVTLLVGAFNRSPLFGKFYEPKSGPFAGEQIPVVASIREAFPEYRQDDPEVAEDIKNGRLELEVKKHWPDIMTMMAKYEKGEIV